MANKKSAKKTPKAIGVKKPVAKPAAAKGKNAAAKKSASKKAKVKPAPKKAAPVKKPVAKKAANKKVITKPVSKPAAKNVPVKKAVVKSAAPKGKKPLAKKATTAKPVNKAVADVKNNQVPKPATKVATRPVPVKTKKRLPVITQAPVHAMADDDTLAKAANIQDENKPSIILPGADTVKASDPLLAFDKHTAEKAMAKGDPNSKIKFSSKPKNAIKPSGKKPLW